MAFFGLRDIERFYREAGDRFAAGALAFPHLGLALGQRARQELFEPRQVLLPAQDRRAISFQSRSLGAAPQPGNFEVFGSPRSMNATMKDIKRRVARRRKMARFRRNPARRLGR